MNTRTSTRGRWWGANRRGVPVACIYVCVCAFCIYVVIYACSSFRRGFGGDGPGDS